MDKEQQIRINFLDEAEEYFDQIESVILGFATNVAEPEPVDRAMRAAHSVKGGAAMMGFLPLSQVAHRLEDFLKILRLRYQLQNVNEDVETLLLKGVDCMRQVSSLHRQDAAMDENWLERASEEIFEPLHNLLGDLQAEDEDALMQQDEGVEPALMMFEEGVDAILDRFEAQSQTADPEQLRQELLLTVEELVAFGFMAELQPFIQLCQSVQAQASVVDAQQLKPLTERALSLWRRSHALVMRGSLDKLPDEIEDFGSQNAAAIAPETSIPAAEQNGNFAFADPTFDDDALDLASVMDDVWGTPDSEMNEFADLDPADLLAEQGTEASESQIEAEADFEFDAEPDLGDFLDFEIEGEDDLAGLQAALSAVDDQLDNFELADGEDLAALQENFAALTEEAIASSGVAHPTTPLSSTKAISKSATPAASQVGSTESKTIRVPVDQLKQFNNLFGKLVLERNTVNLRLDQLKNFVGLMRQRIYQLELSNTKLRKWYDRASLEGIVPTTQLQSASEAEGLSPNTPNRITTSEALQDSFDALEMDRYSDLHLISQEQIETIVQLQEVSADVDLELQEMTLAVQNLNQTTQSLQGNVTRTQMLSFGEVVKRYPRAVRDLSNQFNKPVDLVVNGESTLMDRGVLGALGNPLMHLLRNAFDHGIEDPQTRLAKGKPEKGTIKLNAVNRGLQTVITIQDDGGGIALDKIRRRVQEMGLTEAEIQRMSETDLLDCIFEPGFSTADQVTELSGRGVGMDIVRTALKEIRGDIQVHSQPGVGTTFTLYVPFTLSILRVMLLEQAGMVFAVPADTVKEVQRLESEWMTDDDGLAYFERDDQKIPLVFLEKYLAFQRPGKPFAISGTPIINQPIALMVGENNDINGSLYITRHWGEQEVTLRSVDSPLPLPPGFISSIVLGDGRVVPLVDPLHLMEWCLEDHDSDVPVGDRLSMSASQERDETPKILIVDDSVNVRRYLALTLEKAGYQVEQAKDGQDAVDKLNSGLPVQAVICDIEMPRLDGYGVLETVKASPKFQHLPFAMLTSRSNEKHRKLAMNLGASAYFSKPYEEKQLLETLNNLIQQAKPSYSLV